MDGRLVTQPAEMKVVRLVVELRDGQSWSFVKIAEELNFRKLPTRKGSQWNRFTAKAVYRKWTGKV